MNKRQEPRLRFKGFTGEWKNKTLGDLGRVEMCRRIFKEQTQPSGEIPFLKSVHLDKNQTHLSVVNYLRNIARNTLILNKEIF